MWPPAEAVEAALCSFVLASGATLRIETGALDEYIGSSAKREWVFVEAPRRGQRMNFKRRAKNRRAGCLMCKPHKMNGAKNAKTVAEKRTALQATDDL